MIEQEPSMNKPESLIPMFESRDNPEIVFLDNLFKELQSGAYLSFVAKGAEDSKDIGNLTAIRILAQQDEQVKSIFFFAERDKRRLRKALRNGNKMISVKVDGDPAAFEKLALGVLKNLSQQTISAMSISENRQTGKDVVRVHFPAAFMNLDPYCPPSSKESVGLSVAAYFLKKVPFR